MLVNDNESDSAAPCFIDKGETVWMKTKDYTSLEGTVHFKFASPYYLVLCRVLRNPNATSSEDAVHYKPVLVDSVPDMPIAKTLVQSQLGGVESS